jgi:hypothetical protein
MTYVAIQNSAARVIPTLQLCMPHKPIQYSNQAHGAIARLVLGDLLQKTSHMSENARKAFPCPNVSTATVCDNFIPEYTTCYDIKRCYTACFYNRDEPLYFLEATDSWVPISIVGKPDLAQGYYLIESSRPIQLGPFSLAKKTGKDMYQLTVRSQVAQRMLQTGVIADSDLKYFLRPTYSINESKCKQMVDYLYGLNIGDKDKKLIMNAYIGTLGKDNANLSAYTLSNSPAINLALWCEKKVTRVRSIDSPTKMESETDLQEQPADLQ